MDEFGNLVTSAFNANDFTQCFWLFISLCVLVLSFFAAKKELGKQWMRIVYLLLVAALSLYIAYWFGRIMMWD